jgi:hypothetical protein
VRSLLRGLAVAVAAALVVVVVPSGASADTTLTSSCTDGGKHRWQGRAVWGAEYRDAAGVKRVASEAVGFTSAAPDATTVDYSIKAYDGSGKRIYSVAQKDRRFAFRGGTVYLTRNPRNPPSAPGKTKIVVNVGDGNDGRGNCTMTFVQPTAVRPVPSGSWPSAPPAKLCGNASLLRGPATAPAGAIVVRAGNNGSVDLERAGKTYWFAPGVHRLGSGAFDQIAPADNSTYIGGPGAILDGQRKNAYAFTGRGRSVTIKYLTIRNFVAPMNEGTVNHDSGVDWTMQYNTVVNNGGAGIFVGAGNVASYNCLKDNSQYGFQAYGPNGGESNIVLDHNEIVGNNTGDWEARQPGCGCTGGGKFWDVRNVRVTNNYVHDNRSVGLWADTNDNNFLFEGNWIEDNAGQGIFWETSYNVAIRKNVIRHNQVVDGPARIRSGDNFPDAAIYISESGGDSRLASTLVGSATIDISNNLIEDNYNGVTLWENADRFCGSPANTSSDYCTLVNPSVAKLSTCTSKNIAKAPYYSDCRWKTQNVKVHHNTFTMNRANFFNCPTSMCGRNAIFSNWGSYPSWSPYQGEKISKAIVHNQGNTFSDNRYVGPWSFTVGETGQLIPRSAWQAAPYNQDARSTFTG